MKFNTLYTLVFLGAISGCSSKIYLSGKYEGIMPCADCEGIKSSLFLDKAGVYTLNSTYIGRDEYTYQTSGIWFVRQDDKILELVDDRMQYHIIDDCALELLDTNGKRVELGEHYQIKK